MTCTVRVVTCDQLDAEAGGLFADHWREVGFPGTFALDRERYRMIEQAGDLHCLAAYVGDAVVGYCVLVLASRQLHQADGAALIQAAYVAPAHRSKGVWRALHGAAKAAAREVGLRYLMAHAAPGSAMERVLEAAGYLVAHTVYRSEVRDGGS